nr:xylulose kinase-1 [Tanacetum cinerariifolium]
MLLVVQVFLLVVLVHADGLVPAGSYTIPTGSYSFMLLDWSHIRYALTHHPPIVFDSLVKQFWATATVCTLEAGPSEIIATIDGNEVVVTESLIRTHLKLNDETGLYEFTLNDVLDGMRKIRTYNFSRFILDGMIGNIGSKRHKFLMYPRFLQMILGIQTSDPSPRPAFDFTTKLFSNMKLNWDGPHMPLLAPMLVVPAGGDGADAAVAGATAANEVPPPPPPPVTPSPNVPPTHTSSSTPGPSTAEHDTPVKEPTPTAGGAEDSAALTDLSLKLDRCINRVRTLENKLGVTKKVLGGAVLKLFSKVKKLLQKSKKLTLMLFMSWLACPWEAIQLLRLLTPSPKLPKMLMPPQMLVMMKTSTPIHTTGGVSAGSSMDPGGQAATVAPSSSVIPAADKGKALMVDDSIPADLLTEQEQVLKNLHDSQLGEDLAKKLQAEQEAEFARQQEELAQKAQDKSVASPAAQDWLELMAKIATNSALSKQLLGDIVNEDNMNERLGMLLMRKRRELAEPKPTLKAPSAKRARQGVPQVVHDASSQVPAASLQVPAAPSIAADVLVFTVSTTTADVSAAPTLSTELPIPTSVSASVSLRRRHKQIAKKGLPPYWRLYPCVHVHGLENVDGRVIYMFVDVFYPLSEATLERMLRHGLEVPKLLVGGDLTMAEQLVRFIKAGLLNAQSAV